MPQMMKSEFGMLPGEAANLRAVDRLHAMFAGRIDWHRLDSLHWDMMRDGLTFDEIAAEIAATEAH
jgi:hypothetical protein